MVCVAGISFLGGKYISLKRKTEMLSDAGKEAQN
jgi:hypothetical protein